MLHHPVLIHEYPGELLVALTCRTNFSECLAELKRGASPVAHIDEQVKDSQKLLRQGSGI